MDTPAAAYTTVPALARRMGLHRDSIVTLLRSGRLSAIRNGPRGKYLIPVEEVERLLESMRAAGRPAAEGA